MFNMAAVISLVLLVGMSALWARSYWRSDEVVWRHLAGVEWVRTEKGHLEIGARMVYWPSQPGDPLGFKYRQEEAFGPVNVFPLLSTDMGDTTFNWEWRDFSYYSIRNRNRSRYHADAIMPFWSIACVLAVLPVGWLLMRWRSGVNERRRIRQGVCRVCGYDLRATPDRCPECGTVAKVGPE
jgi:hypothetical protein